MEFPGAGKDHYHEAIKQIDVPTLIFAGEHEVRHISAPCLLHSRSTSGSFLTYFCRPIFVSFIFNLRSSSPQFSLSFFMSETRLQELIGFSKESLEEVRDFSRCCL